jgi:glycerophosphoryl diester phosphodiesterase
MTRTPSEDATRSGSTASAPCANASRIAAIRPGSAAHDDEETVLALPDLLRILDEESARLGRPLGMVAEIKHATHFASLGLPLDELLARDLRAHGWADDASRLTIEAFERDVLLRVRAAGIRARLVYLLEGRGAAVDEAAPRPSRR